MARRRGRRFLRCAGIAIVILAALVVSAKYWLGHTIKGAVNGFGPKAMGVPVQVEDVAVDLLRGKVELLTLTVGNPEGFDATPYLFKLDGMTLDIDMHDTVRGNVHISDIVIDGPHVWYHKKLTSSNVSALLDILEEKYPSDGKPKKKDDKERESDSKPVVIDHILVKEGTVGVRVGVGVEVPLLEIELNDLGKEGALMPVQVVKILVTAIVKGTLSAVANIGGLAVDAVEGVGKGAVGVVENVGKGAVGVVENVGEAAADAVKGVFGAVGSVFGGSSKTNAPAPDGE